MTEDELIVTHYNDGKGKWQSHEVGCKELAIYGYGDTKEEAYQQFIIKLGSYVDALQEFRDSVSLDTLVKGDCFGNPV